MHAIRFVKRPGAKVANADKLVPVYFLVLSQGIVDQADAVVFTWLACVSSSRRGIRSTIHLRTGLVGVRFTASFQDAFASLSLYES